MSNPAGPSLSRQGSFSMIDSGDAQQACMAFPCAIRGKIADALRENHETWSGTSWERKLELLKAEAPSQGRARERRASVIEALAFGLYNAASAVDLVTNTNTNGSALRKFRLLAKKALWTTRKDALVKRSSLWWGIESHLRVEKCRKLFEGINKSRQEYENLPPLEYEMYLNKLFAAIPIDQIFPTAGTIRAPAEDDIAPALTSSHHSAGAQPTYPWIILPNSSFRTAWDTLTLFFLLYCAYSVPAQMSFSSDIPLYYIPPGQEESLDSSVNNETTWADYLDLCVDIMFLLDVVFNFRTAFYRQHSTRSMVQHPLPTAFFCNIQRRPSSHSVFL
jgi:hypothetical protein